VYGFRISLLSKTIKYKIRQLTFRVYQKPKGDKMRTIAIVKIAQGNRIPLTRELTQKMNVKKVIIS